MIECKGGCGATIPDEDFYTIDAAGWGFVEAPDPGAPENHDGSMGLGQFYACSTCKDDWFPLVENTPEPKESNDGS